MRVIYLLPSLRILLLRDPPLLSRSCCCCRWDLCHWVAIIILKKWVFIILGLRAFDDNKTDEFSEISKLPSAYDPPYLGTFSKIHPFLYCYPPVRQAIFCNFGIKRDNHIWLIVDYPNHYCLSFLDQSFEIEKIDNNFLQQNKFSQFIKYLEAWNWKITRCTCPSSMQISVDGEQTSY